MLKYAAASPGANAMPGSFGSLLGRFPASAHGPGPLDSIFCPVLDDLTSQPSTKASRISRDFERLTAAEEAELAELAAATPEVPDDGVIDVENEDDFLGDGIEIPTKQVRNDEFMRFLSPFQISSSLQAPPPDGTVSGVTSTKGLRRLSSVRPGSLPPGLLRNGCTPLSIAKKAPHLKQTEMTLRCHRLHLPSSIPGTTRIRTGRTATTAGERKAPLRRLPPIAPPSPNRLLLRGTTATVTTTIRTPTPTPTPIPTTDGPTPLPQVHVLGRQDSMIKKKNDPMGLSVVRCSTSAFSSTSWLTKKARPRPMDQLPAAGGYPQTAPTPPVSGSLAPFLPPLPRTTSRDNRLPGGGRPGLQVLESVFCAFNSISRVTLKKDFIVTDSGENPTGFGRLARVRGNLLLWEDAR
ncbi:hypothetical protein PAPYR_8083 [Paratrimastix pyriformis]|uniref:Uncharacterized protein n=1 Tax=Paratrimastix pyriformis TaxID=342808 RepID=A0ABQ8UH11_9EUKA|nr:hypothetical protein PAPYR_8083 [Paratrimastix pyriformis]